ncbi:NAD-dependent protein deacylase [Atopococcus tabaci]|uniref:NAD-dependent protein deacylase n=1 Tax=Atopococcus tabaci TaxID=269774 RepID=UPI00240939C9|nr:NAD-dependent protein deacylase [Atopococcus tabaci]
MTKDSIALLQNYIDEASLIAFFGGAGVSTESGIPDYRSPEGTYSEMEKRDLDPEVLMSKRYLLQHPEDFFERRRREKAAKPVYPNAAHRYLAQLEQAGKDVRIITQNVDGLHQTAGSRYVLELHGTDRYWYCMECERHFSYEELVYDERGIPRCHIDQGIIRPAVVYFGEHPDRRLLEKSRETIRKADLLIIAGTSLTVNPAKNLIRRFNGDRVVVVNTEPIDTGKLPVDLFIQYPIGEIFSRLEVNQPKSSRR